MNLKNFWPNEQFIAQCIRTEAEELPEHVLLAVHEPMRLSRIGETTETKTEQDLLNDFLKTERPIPIIGRSGVGKSHLIRWIDAQLKLKPECAQWHIVRIPKNASLRQVLELLLADLEGEVFDKARQNISTVGEQLSTKNVAELLLTFMSQQLGKLREQLNHRIQELQLHPELKQQLSDQEKAEIRRIKAHTSENKGLAELITDPYFKQFLLQPTHCIYKFAERLTAGASALDLAEYNYQLYADDLDFTLNTDDLSIGARTYIKDARLNTVLSAREEAASVLNDILSDANKALFQQLFSFSSGSFIDLFKDIRRLLKQHNRTLVVLVEDMAAISAIEDVLIDSLLEESMTAGEQELCVVRSAIAVTDGYAGYLKRQGTIKTRAQYEWYISDQVEEGEPLNQRIIEFVARYLNAARFGGAELLKQWETHVGQAWPPVWAQADIDESVQAYGFSTQLNIPLFPFNANAILALANKFCVEDNQIKFNPRKILNQIILRVLKENKAEFEANQFPFANFAEITLSPNVRGHLNQFDDPSRCNAVAAIWGYDSRSIDELAVRLDYRIASGFGLVDFAEFLQHYELKGTSRVHQPQSVTPSIIETSKVAQPASQKTVSEKLHETVSTLEIDPLQVEFNHIDQVLEQWLQPTKPILLDQETAKTLRQELEQMFTLYVNTDPHCFNLSAAFKAKIRTSNNRVYIEIPNAQANLPGSILKFFEFKDLKNEAILAEIQSISSALLRNAIAKQKGFTAWSYPDGYRDYLIYQNFSMHWVPSALQLFITEMRTQAESGLKSHMEAAYRLGVWKNDENAQQRLDTLLLNTQELLNAEEAKYFGEIALFEELRKPLEHWDTLRKTWLDVFSQNDHVYEGKLAVDLFKKIDRDLSVFSIFSSFRQPFENGQRKLQTIFAQFDFGTKEAYSQALKMMKQNIEKVRDQGKHYPSHSNILPNANDFISLIQRLDQTACWEMIKGIVTFLADLNSEHGIDWKKVVENVQRIDATHLEDVKQLLSYWQEFYQKSYARIQSDNQNNGVESLDRARQKVTDLLDHLELTVEGL
ncbi:protein DpdH [uncultured Acinetobacter sp.]|uniref:protein DpdH n=1 Tax=uncultured Acinetobacter sp. TaxID=165433 RepID=UPI002615E7FD|nr:protein DpdH [uncultured Acinetobacter sp.]